jgi:hypothetical protein
MINAAADNYGRISEDNAFKPNQEQSIPSDYVFLQETGKVPPTNKDPLLYMEALTPAIPINSAVDNVNRISRSNQFTPNKAQGQIIHGPIGVDSASNVRYLSNEPYIISTNSKTFQYK